MTGQLKAFVDRGKELTKSYKVILLNFSYLSIIQVFNIVFPLLAYPFLIRVLGKDVYGRIIFAQALMGYFVIIINFGFNITATKEISVNLSNPEKITEIVSTTFIVKGVLFLLSIVALFILQFFIADIREYTALFYLMLWMCLYEFLFPIWYFQGTEKMSYITIFTLTSRIIFLVFIFIFIRNKDNYLLVPIINGAGALIASLGAIGVLARDKVKFRWQPVSVLFHYIKMSYVMALSYAFNSITTNMSILIVKFFTSYSSVAYFDLANKITNIGIIFLDLISQTVFPKISKTRDKALLKKFVKLSVIAALIILVIIQVFAPLMIKILGGVQMKDALGLLRILALCLPFYIFGAMLGRNGLFVFGYSNKILTSMSLSAVVYLFLVIVLKLIFPNSLLTIVAVAVVGNIMFEAFYRYFVCRNRGIYKII